MTLEQASLIARIRENSCLPAAEQQRYERLRLKCERRTLTKRELTAYRSLLRELEARNAARVEAIIDLSKRRGTTPERVIAELWLDSRGDAE